MVMLAPVPFRSGQSGRDALDEKFCSPENQLRPASDDRVRFGETEVIWRRVELEDYTVDFAKLSGRVNERCVAYAVCYVESETERSGVRLLVGSDDMAKVYLNGQQIHRTPFQRGYREDEDSVEGLRLHAGTNVLVFKSRGQANVSEHSPRNTPNSFHSGRGGGESKRSQGGRCSYARSGARELL